jgi:thioredoxin 1
VGFGLKAGWFRQDRDTEAAIMAGANTKTFTTANFDSEVLKSEVPVLVDFWAEWCGPCKALGPTIDALADELQGKAKVGKLDTDSNQQIAVQYGIQAIPTVIIFKGGKPVAKMTGARQKADYLASLQV